MVLSNIQGIAIILLLIGIAWKLAPRTVSIAGHDAGQLFLLAALPLFFIDFGTSAEYAAGELMNVLSAQHLQMYAPIGVLAIALLNIAFGGLYIYALGVFRDGGGAYTASLRYLGPAVALTVAFLLLEDYTLTIVVSSLSGADQLLSSISALDAGPIVHIVLGMGIAFLTCWLTLRGRRDASRVTFVILFVYAALMLITFIALATQSSVQHVPPVPMPTPSPDLPVPQIAAIIGNSILHGLVALTGLEAVSNGVLFIKNQDAGYVAWGKEHLPQFSGFWNFFSGRTGVARTIQVGFLFWGGLTTALNVHFSNYFGVIDGTNNRTLVGNLAFIALVPLGGQVLYIFRQAWSSLTLSFANMTAYEDMQSTAYRDGVIGVLPVSLVYRSPNGNFPRPVLGAFGIASLIMILVGGNTSAAIPFYGIGVFAPIAFMGFAVRKHLLANKPQHYRVSAAAVLVISWLSVFIFFSQIVGKFEEGGWIRLITFSSMFIMAHAILLSKNGERNDQVAHHLIHDVSRIEGTMAELLMWQVHMIQTYRHNLHERIQNLRSRKKAQEKPVPYPIYEIHYDTH